ncbi:uncharacterized protein LOC131884927 isoform X1 [Tigriopus californicus]|uniref:uncharacterized protein LOC131884927 isoform X1 n=1 Tax=Tigriopus californicus TaxID=6832 RepID=UPI0027DA413C|nr:uncharacterized protein LOC131884927 isoform X1 [Tigriopus californicus]XP_059088806.1 uncharacterized protein LOC131884927 isoform X1 [Tigriopus californicus]
MAMDRHQRRMTAPDVSAMAKTSGRRESGSGSHGHSGGSVPKFKPSPQKLHGSSKSLPMHPHHLHHISSSSLRLTRSRSPEEGSASRHLSPLSSSSIGSRKSLAPPNQASPLRRRRIFGNRTRSASPRNISPRRRQLPTTPFQRRPSKRLEDTLRKFTDFALPFHLDMISQHRNNINKLQAEGDWVKVRHEVNLASRAVHQLGSLLFEMEILRSYLEPNELPYFDAKVIPAKTSALVVIHGLQEMCPGTVGNYSHFAQARRLSMAGMRSNSLTEKTRSPESPVCGTSYNGVRRHSDSETQSCNSLPYSLSEEQSLIQDEPSIHCDSVTLQTQPVATSGISNNNNPLNNRIKIKSSYLVPCHSHPPSPSSNYENPQGNPNNNDITVCESSSSPTLILGDGSIHESDGATKSLVEKPGTAYSNTRGTGGGGGQGGGGGGGGGSAAGQAGTVTSPQQQGGGTLEVLYEDPKEDSISILSGEDGTATRGELECQGQSVSNLEHDPPPSSIYSSKPPPSQLRTIPNTYKQGTILSTSLGAVNHWGTTSINDLDRRKDTLQSWQRLEEEIRDFQLLIAEFSSNVVVTDKSGGDALNTLQNVQNSCRVRTSHISSSAIYPVAGALLGTCLGGPVGLLAGVKIGGLAAIGGSVFGYTTGSVIKEHKERQDYIDDFYACHPNASRPLMTRTASIRQQESAKRAQSLPDVLNDEDDGLLATDSSPLLARPRSNSIRTRKRSTQAKSPSRCQYYAIMSESGGSHPNMAMGNSQHQQYRPKPHQQLHHLQRHQQQQQQQQQQQPQQQHHQLARSSSAQRAATRSVENLLCD